MIRNRIAEKSSRRGNARLAWSLLAILGAAFLFSFARVAAKEVSALTALQDATANAPKLAGHWQLNKDQSDDLRQKMQAARGDSGGGGGRGQGGHNGEGRAQRAGMMDEFQTLAIEQTGSNVKVTGKSGRVLAQYPPGRFDRRKKRGPGRRRPENNHGSMAKWPADRSDPEPTREIHSHLQLIPGWQAVVRDHKNGKRAIQGTADVSLGLRPGRQQFRLRSVESSSAL
jgi:hypothetical protein